jgi:UV DNA damage endonuclease
MTHSFDQSIKRLGFCCKYMDPDQSQPKKILEERQRPLNTRSTTATWLKRQTKQVAEAKMLELSLHNIESYRKLIEYVGTLPENLRMVRLGSDCLPCFTERSLSYYYRDPGIQQILADSFSRVGATARRLDVRIGWHPGQFCCLGSDNPEVVDRSLEELEYHATMARWMGYGQTDFDTSINVHLSGRAGAEGFLKTLPKMSEALRKTLTLENDEYQAGLNDLLPLYKHVGIMLDIHHHLIHDGEFISADDPRIKQVIDSWRGNLPQIHYSQSREEYMQHFSRDYMPTWEEMLAVSKKGNLRAHSDFYYNTAINEWALNHLKWADIECECKGKNLASLALYRQFLERTEIFSCPPSLCMLDVSY